MCLRVKGDFKSEHLRRTTIILSFKIFPLMKGPILCFFEYVHLYWLRHDVLIPFYISDIISKNIIQIIILVYYSLYLK